MSQRLVGDRDFVWLDLVEPTHEELAAAEKRFSIKAIDALPKSAPQLHEEADFVRMSLVGGAELPWLTLYLDHDRRWIVSTHGGASFVNTEGEGAVRGLERLADVLVSGLVGGVRALEDEVDDAADAPRAELGSLRRRIAAARRVASAERDILERGSHPYRSSGLQRMTARLSQALADLDVLREELFEVASDRQEDVVRRLTIVAAVFLPLTFLTGFFGQNFPWLVDHIGGPWWFIVLGIVLPVASVAALLGFFRLKRWL